MKNISCCVSANCKRVISSHKVPTKTNNPDSFFFQCTPSNIPIIFCKGFIPSHRGLLVTATEFSLTFTRIFLKFIRRIPGCYQNKDPGRYLFFGRDFAVRPVIGLGHSFLFDPWIVQLLTNISFISYLKLSRKKKQWHLH